MRLAGSLALMLGLFLVAGLLLGWGTGTAARGLKRRPRYRFEIGRWAGGDRRRRLAGRGDQPSSELVPRDGDHPDRRRPR